jgi:adenylate cyclase
MKWLSRLGRRFTSARALCLALLFALMFLRTTDPGPLEELRLRAFDIFQVIKPRDATSRPGRHCRYRRSEPAKARPVSVAAERALPTMITRLTRLGAAAIAFDVDLLRAGPAVAGARRRTSYRDLDEETRNKLRALAEQRPESWTMRCGRPRGRAGPDRVADLSSRNPDVQLPFAGVAALGGIPKRLFDSSPGSCETIPEFSKMPPQGRALFSIAPSRDGIVRRVPMVVCKRKG